MCCIYRFSQFRASVSSAPTSSPFLCPLRRVRVRLLTLLFPLSCSHSLPHGSNLQFFHSSPSLVPSICAGLADLPTCTSISCQYDCWTTQGHDVWTSLSLLVCVFPFTVLVDPCVHVMFLNVCVYSMFNFWSFCSQNCKRVYSCCPP